MLELLRRSFKIGRVTETTKLGEVSSTLVENKPFGCSLHIRHLDCGSCNGCDWEMTALLNSIYDIQQYGFDFVASPRHADILMCTGPVSVHLTRAALDTYEATPSPKWVIAVGDCALDGGIFKEGYASLDGVSSTLPVDLHIPGCPPTPQDLVDGLLKIMRKSKD